MRHTDLILRDREYAALLGNMEPDFGSDTAVLDGVFDDDSASADFGFDDDDDFGADAPSAAMTASTQASKMLHHPAHAAKAHAIIAKHLHRQHLESQSQQRLNPNHGNARPTYRWAFSVTGTIAAVGTAAAIGGASGISGAPNIGVFNPDTLTCNTPQPGFIYLQDVKVLSQSLLVGGAGDAWKYAPVSTSKKLQSVPLNPAIPVVVLSTYSGMPIIGLSTFTGAFGVDYNFEGWSSPTGMPVAVQQ